MVFLQFSLCLPDQADGLLLRWFEPRCDRDLRYYPVLQTAPENGAARSILEGSIPA